MTLYTQEKPKRAEAYPLADVGTRLVALIIDTLILGFVGGIVAIGARHGAGWLVSFIVGVAYHWYFMTQRDGQTPGKQLVGIRVVRADGEPLTATDAIMRYIGYYINTAVLMLGWIWALFDDRRQGWHDKIANTLVIQAR